MEKPREIIQLGHEVLRKTAVMVADVKSDEIQTVIEAIRATLAVSDGVGIAAPQINESVRIIIVASRPTPRYPNAPVMDPTVMINPSFQKLTTEKEKDWEGCLSIPGIRARVPRYREISVIYQDVDGKEKETDLEGFPARVFQHEYDHLNGIVYLDRVENNRDIIAESEFYKLMGIQERVLNDLNNQGEALASPDS